MATLELKELNERQRSDHLDSQLRLARDHRSSVEARNDELESKLSEVTRANLEMQRAERELREQIVTSVPREQCQEVQQRVQVMMKIILVFLQEFRSSIHSITYLLLFL